MSYTVLSCSPTFGYYASEPLEYLRSRGCKVTLVPEGKKMSETELIDEVKRYDALIVGTEKITKQIIESSGKLKVIAKHGAGVDNIDVEASTRRGIVVVNAPAANSDAVADLTMGLFISLARNICYADRSVRAGGWARIVGDQMSGKVLGIIGLGEIGKRVAKRGVGFNMKLVGYDVYNDELFAKQWGMSYVSLNELLSQSDFVSIHVPLTNETRGMIGKRELCLMKKSSYLVHISRGGVVEESDLYDALKEGRPRAAALDAFSHEPPKGNPLLTLENVIVTPHMGGYTIEALRETGMICAKSIMDVFEGRRPKTAVNP
jgi:D-3-phosphoglycerate dehydrogenase